MIPVKLVIEGLYSYQERVEIDFARLTEGRLFGIFGSVGSGKSALLEAMTYALYGTSDRIDRAGRRYNMMNLRSKQLFISFEFTFGATEERYKFEVRSKRENKDFTSIRLVDHIGYQWADDEWVPLDLTTAEPILGLSYENFIKTIIIPQGKFQEFLHLTATPRAEMLQEIFALQKFDLAAPTKRMIARNQHAISRLEGSLAEVPEIPAEEFQQVQERQRNLEQELKNLQATLERLEKQDAEMAQIKEIKDSLANVQEVLDLLEPTEAEFKERAERLQRFRLVKGAFDETLQRQGSLQESRDRLLLDQQHLEEERTPLQEEVNNLNSQFDAAKEAYEGREVWREKANDLETMLRLRQEQASLEAGQEKLVKVQGQVNEYQDDDKHLGAFVARGEKWKLAFQNEMPDGELLMALRAWFDQMNFRKEGVQEAEEELARMKARQRQERDELVQWISQPLVQSVAEGTRSLPEAGEQLLKMIDEHRDRLDALEAERDGLQMHAGLAPFAEELQTGEPCPLCGSTSHPAPFHDGAIADKVDGLRQRTTAVRSYLRQLESLRPDLERRQSDAERTTRELENAQQRVEERATQMARHKEAFVWEGYSPDRPEDLEALQRKDREMREEYSRREAEYRAGRRKLEIARRHLALSQQELIELETEKAARQGRIETLSASLKNFTVEEFDGVTNTQLREQQREFQEEYHQISEQYQLLASRLEIRQERLREVGKNIEFAGRELERLTGELETLAAALQEKLSLHKLENLGEVQNILSWNLDPFAEEEEITQFRKDLEAARTEWNTYKKQEEGRTYDAEAHHLIKVELEAAKPQRRIKEQELAEIGFRLRQMESRMKKRELLNQEMAQLQIRAENLRVLEKLFKKKGFVNYVSTIYLRELCQRANARFQQLTRHQLSLEIDEKNDFQVRDNLNGGHLRSVKTLSGGQTFQASLCLALALADNITQRMGSTHNFFFLDEGFGTLDRDSLTLVFETLKKLRKENRIVGVISHVEELQQEIDHYLHIRKDDERGSLVRGSWE